MDIEKIVYLVKFVNDKSKQLNLDPHEFQYATYLLQQAASFGWFKSAMKESNKE
jgi:hypothetical protein